MEENEDIYDDLDDAFFTEGYSLAKKHLENNRSLNAMHEMVKGLYSTLENLMEMFQNQCKEADYKVDCKKKCSWCCKQSALILPYEASYLAEYIEKNTAPRDLSQLKERILEKYEITSALNIIQLVSYREKCPLLKDDDTCIAYEARPTACRLHLSMNASSCEANCKDPANEEIFAELYEFPLRAGRIMNSGISKFLSEKGLISEEWTLEYHLSTLLNNNSITEQWIEGKYNFVLPEMTKEETEFLDNLNITIK